MADRGATETWLNGIPALKRTKTVRSDASIPAPRTTKAPVQGMIA
ncbi:MAG: hypothetical protein BWY85_02407 [Firmicutes bacterium ADurb.Bin506]|nr:MAG: hypothetical protein BWY85_02407 [Firmicutes bacterium ADurb.Bin506]